jgi:hypothetical protein
MYLVAALRWPTYITREPYINYLHDKLRESKNLCVKTSAQPNSVALKTKLLCALPVHKNWNGAH